MHRLRPGLRPGRLRRRARTGWSGVRPWQVLQNRRAELTAAVRAYRSDRLVHPAAIGTCVHRAPPAAARLAGDQSIGRNPAPQQLTRGMPSRMRKTDRRRLMFTSVAVWIGVGEHATRPTRHKGPIRNRRSGGPDVGDGRVMGACRWTMVVGRVHPCKRREEWALFRSELHRASRIAGFACSVCSSHSSPQSVSAVDCSVEERGGCSDATLP